MKLWSGELTALLIENGMRFEFQGRVGMEPLTMRLAASVTPTFLKTLLEDLKLLTKMLALYPDIF